MNRRFFLAVMSLFLLWQGDALAACYGNFRDEKSTASMLVLRHPAQRRAVLFTKPVALPGGGGGCDAIAWRRVEIATSPDKPGSKSIVGGYDPKDKATLYLPDTDTELLWSPDGRFMAIYRVTNDGTGGMIREFLDVEQAAWTAFLTEDESSYASTDNFLGWAAPHTALLNNPKGSGGTPVPAFPVD